MKLRSLRLATMFLTRVPVPAVADYSPEELSRSAAWFPLIGLVVGAAVGLTFWLCGYRSPLLAAVLATTVWVFLTGALHLDGLADLSDALGASHRDPQKFFPVLADPHLGTFGGVAIVLVLMLKATALAQLTPATLFALPLIPAWARLGPLAWSRWLKPLKPGHGERFAQHLSVGWMILWTALLLLGSAATAPILCAAPIAIGAWGLWLRWRLGGTTGDCLGAGVEVVEVVLLVALTLASGIRAILPL